MTTTIRNIVSDLYLDNTITEYTVRPDGTIRAEIGGASTIFEVGPDLDPEHPELDDTTKGYVWTCYADGNACDWGGDDTLETLAATIKRLANLRRL